MNSEKSKFKKYIGYVVVVPVSVIIGTIIPAYKDVIKNFMSTGDSIASPTQISIGFFGIDFSSSQQLHVFVTIVVLFLIWLAISSVLRWRMLSIQDRKNHLDHESKMQESTSQPRSENTHSNDINRDQPQSENST